jgi:hypothetical protein
MNAIGNAKTVFYVNISSDAAHYNESLCTLRFANTLRNCELAYRKSKKK